MNLRVRGFEGTQARIQEIRAKMAQLEGRMNGAAQPNNFAATLGGDIGKGKAPSQATPPRLGLGFNSMMDDNAPFDPRPFIPPSMLNQASNSSNSDIKALAAQIAERYGVDPALFSALIQQESGFNPRAVSAAGAQGLTQLMPKTGRSLGVTDPFDPTQNLEGGAKYLAQMLKEFGGDRRLALAAYNAGPGAVKRYGGIPPFTETQNYVKKILDNLGGN